jgi:hypothetical protein
MLLVFFIKPSWRALLVLVVTVTQGLARVI